MGRQKSVAYLQQQLKYAEAKAAHVKTVREAGSSSKRRPRIPLRYLVMTNPSIDTIHFTVRVPKASLDFFGDETGTELGLAVASGDGNPPRHFEPAKLHAVKSVAEPTVVKAVASTRPYLKYSGTGGQSSYSAAASSTAGERGVALLVKTIFTEKEAVLGPYGRIYRTPEYYPISE